MPDDQEAHDAAAAERHDERLVEARKVEAERARLAQQLADERIQRAADLAADADRATARTAKDLEAETVERAARLAQQRISLAQQLAIDEDRAVRRLEADRLVRATDLAVEADRLRQRLDTAVLDLAGLKAESASVRLSVAQNTVALREMAMVQKYQTEKLFGGLNPNDTGEFGRLYEKIEGGAAKTVLKYLMGIVAVVVAGVALAYLVSRNTPQFIPTPPPSATATAKP
jgi:hypothetical protein